MLAPAQTCLYPMRNSGYTPFILHSTNLALLVEIAKEGHILSAFNTYA